MSSLLNPYWYVAGDFPYYEELGRETLSSPSATISVTGLEAKDNLLILVFPIIDTTLFEENRLYRPMAGRVYKMFPVETIRGCPFTCTFCNSPDQMRLYKGLNKNYYRKKRMDLVYKELRHFKEIHKVEISNLCSSKILLVNGEEFCWFGSRLETAPI